MKSRDLVELVVLAALWGASFLFMRVLAPVAGPWATADLRMLFGGVFLGVVFTLMGLNPEWRKTFWRFLVVGLVNSALPFVLYSAASVHLPASTTVVVNALSPVFGAMAGSWFLGEALTKTRAIGLILGFAGVVVLAGGLPREPEVWWALGLAVLAPVCYAAGGVIVKRWAAGVAPQALAFGSQLLAGMALLPTLAWAPPTLLDPGVLGLLAVFGVLCSGVAYLLYYRLMQRVGPTQTLTVTFLMPAFGIVWGSIFLGEVLTLPLAAGVILVLGGTALVSLRRTSARV